jgi:uncharacterized protein with PQ loop repeat
LLAPLSVEFLGALAGFCTTFAFVPQLLKIRKQGGRDLSYGMLLFKSPNRPDSFSHYFHA